jgi:hypothetical protein
MPDRLTTREVKADVEGVKTSVDRQYTLVLGMYGLIAAVVGGGFLLRSDIGDIKKELGQSSAEITGLRRDMTTVQARLDAIAKNTSDLASGQTQLISLQNQIGALLTQMNNKLPTQPLVVVALGPMEEQIVRDFFGLSKISKEPSRYTVGDTLPGASPIPEQLYSKVPRLKGLNYAKDPANGSLLVADALNRVVAIISPA